MIEHALELDYRDQAFLQHCPFFVYQTFLCAAFVLLKVLKSEHFCALIDANDGQRLFNSSISALRKISVSNNDLPGRLSDVLAYLWNHPNPQVVSATGCDGLQLKIQSRMSMSIVYDSLWLWRNQFLENTAATGNIAAGRVSIQLLAMKLTTCRSATNPTPGCHDSWHVHFRRHQCFANGRCLL